MDKQFKKLAREVLVGSVPVKEKHSIDQLDIEEEFRKVWDYALNRFRFGSLEYGEWSPDEDARDILEEIKEEIGDVAIYSGMLIIKINNLMKRLESMELR